MSIQVHVVMGSTGEYSDRSEWPVCAYQDKARADEHADLAKNEAHKLAKARKSRYEDVKEGSNIYDPKMYMDYTGTDYYVLSVDLVDAIPGIDG
jgi:hypothetical protein